jgi:hypothetical protein
MHQPDRNPPSCPWLLAGGGPEVEPEEGKEEVDVEELGQGAEQGGAPMVRPVRPASSCGSP